MVRKIIQIGDDRLNKVSEEIKKSEFGSSELQQILDDLIDTLNAHKDSAAGLSAVQIGILKRVFVVKRVDLENRDEIEVIINPKIKFASKNESLQWEGCMSISSGDQRLYGPVFRSKVVDIEYKDFKGNTKKLTAKDFFSHLIQHEIDHLDGILFLRYVENPKNIWKEEELDIYIDKTGKMPEIK